MYEDILKAYSTLEIVQICKYLNKEYNIYDPNELRWKKIKYAFPKTSQDLLDELRKTTLSNTFLNDLLMEYYICERVVKYHFIRYLKEALDDIVAFEMSIGDSRVDICRINGELCAYEIKTEYDNYDRLATQMKDYFSAFEKVYIIVPAQNVEVVKEYIPEKCGIIAYRVKKDQSMAFSYRRAAKKNNCDIVFCLRSLSNSDLVKMLKLLSSKHGKTKDENLELVMSIAKERNIWPLYRDFLKSKYGGQWNYLKSIFNEILPIDCQCFFSSRIDPSILYEARDDME